MIYLRGSLRNPQLEISTVDSILEFSSQQKALHSMLEAPTLLQICQSSKDAPGFRSQRGQSTPIPLRPISYIPEHWLQLSHLQVDPSRCTFSYWCFTPPIILPLTFAQSIDASKSSSNKPQIATFSPRIK